MISTGTFPAYRGISMEISISLMAGSALMAVKEVFSVCLGILIDVSISLMAGSAAM
jgi:hypothetical protein